MQAAIFPSIAEQIENLALELSVESGLLANAMLEFFLGSATQVMLERKPHAKTALIFNDLRR